MLPGDVWMITLSFHRKYLKLRGRLSQVKTETPGSKIHVVG